MEAKENTAMIKALVNVQKHVLKASKDGTNTFFNNSKYATLDSVLDAVRAPLTDNGFALVQESTTGEMSVSVVTRLLHESGGELISPPLSCALKKEFTKTGLELPPSVQQVGACVTYLRRYSLCPFLGIALEDDDGNHVSQIGKDAVRTPDPAPAGNRRSAYTGEKLGTPEADARHKAAAAAAKPGTPPTGEKPRERADVNADVENAALRAALDKACLRHDQLAAYLRGEFGDPKITKPVLSGSMGVASLGERIVGALLAEKNWGMVVTRIKADPGYLPF